MEIRFRNIEMSESRSSYLHCILSSKSCVWTVVKSRIDFSLRAHICVSLIYRSSVGVANVASDVIQSSSNQRRLFRKWNILKHFSVSRRDILVQLYPFHTAMDTWAYSHHYHRRREHGQSRNSRAAIFGRRSPGGLGVTTLQLLVEGGMDSKCMVRRKNGGTCMGGEEWQVSETGQRFNFAIRSGYLN
jgi:hypothetical protein